MIDEEDPPIRMDTLLPTFRQRTQIVVGFSTLQRSCELIRHRTSPAGPRIHPRGGPLVVIDEEDPTVRRHLYRPALRQPFRLQTGIEAVRGGRIAP